MQAFLRGSDVMAVLQQARRVSPRTWIAVAAVCALMALVLPATWSYSGRLFYAAGAAAGFPLFFAVGLAVMLWMPGSRSLRFRRSALAVSLLAVAVECLQAVTGRDPRWMHGLVLVVGGVAGILWEEGSHSARRWRFLATRGLVLLLALLAGLPVALVMADRSQAYLSFPLLSSFEGRSEVGRWWSHNCRMGRVASQATHGRHALRVVVLKSRSRYPGLFMNDVPRDWSGYPRLCLDVYLAGSAERALWIRADDRPGYPPYDDRAQTMIYLSPGANSVCLDLASFLVTPSGRPLDRTHIARWGLFLDDARGGETLFLDHIRLVP